MGGYVGARVWSYFFVLFTVSVLLARERDPALRAIPALRF
jgi:hypothetical protein